jgi:hypothetical protein
MIFLFLFMCLGILHAEQPDYSITVVEKKDNYQYIQIYVDLVEVRHYEGQHGTSEALNVLVSNDAQSLGMLTHRLNYHSGHKEWEGEIHVYDYKTVKYMPTFKKCNYNNAITCGKQNRHWTLRTVVWVGKKFSTVTTYLHNENGMVIGSGQRTIFGTIRWKPRWKLTKINEQGPFGGGSKEIFEMWPPEMQEIPPLITPAVVTQAIIGAYVIKKQGCTVKTCLD